MNEAKAISLQNVLVVYEKGQVKSVWNIDRTIQGHWYQYVSGKYYRIGEFMVGETPVKFLYIID